MDSRLYIVEMIYNLISTPKGIKNIVINIFLKINHAFSKHRDNQIYSSNVSQKQKWLLSEKVNVIIDAKRVES